jgi:hypothetical protein
MHRPPTELRVERCLSRCLDLCPCTSESSLPHEATSSVEASDLFTNISSLPKAGSSRSSPSLRLGPVGSANALPRTARRPVTSPSPQGPSILTPPPSLPLSRTLNDMNYDFDPIRIFQLPYPNVRPSPTISLKTWMPFQYGTLLRSKVDDVLETGQDAVRLSHLYRIVRRYMCCNYVEHHAAYNPATIPSESQSRGKSFGSASSLLPTGRSVGII